MLKQNTSLSLLTLALVSSSFASEFSLENVIKDVEFEGFMRYRYESHYKNGALVDKNIEPFVSDKMSNANSQKHRYLGFIRLQSGIDDNFKFGTQLSYGEVKDSSFGNGSSANLSTPFNVRELWLSYALSDNANLSFGKQVLQSIWTNGSLEDGFVATTLSLEYEDDYFKYQGFVADNYDTNDGDTILDRREADGLNLSNFFNKNWYGFTLSTNLANFKPQLWLSYMQDRATFWALDLEYKDKLSDDFSYELKAQYLGNSIDWYLKNRNFTNGQFFAAQAALKLYGFDLSVGGLHWGDDKKGSIHSIEDGGRLIFAGEEGMSTLGSSNYSGDIGKNTFGFVTLGYTFFDSLRLGADFVKGGTKTAPDALTRLGGGKKTEYVARINYKYSKRLDFYGYYSLVDIQDVDTGIANIRDDYKNHKIRFQARYRFKK